MLSKGVGKVTSVGEFHLLLKRNAPLLTLNHPLIDGCSVDCVCLELRTWKVTWYLNLDWGHLAKILWLGCQNASIASDHSHRCDGHELGQTPGDGEGQGSLACCSPWGCEELDTTERLNDNNIASKCQRKAVKK